MDPREDYRTESGDAQVEPSPRDKLEILEREENQAKRALLQSEQQLKGIEKTIETQATKLETVVKSLGNAQENLTESSKRRHAAGFAKFADVTGFNLQSPIKGSKEIGFDCISWKSVGIPNYANEFIAGDGYLPGLYLISSNIAARKSVACMGISNTANGQVNCYIVFVHLQANDQFHFTHILIPGYRTCFSISVLNDEFLIVGGRKSATYISKTSKYPCSNSVMSIVDQSRLENKFHPMKHASASPVVSVYKDRVVVVHTDSREIEILDTSRKNPMWFQLPHSFLPRQPTGTGTSVWSATFVGSTLAFTDGHRISCMSLQYLLSDTNQTVPPGVYSIPCPHGLQESRNKIRLVSLQNQLIAIVEGLSTESTSSIYAYRSGSREWVNIDNRQMMAQSMPCALDDSTLFVYPLCNPQNSKLDFRSVSVGKVKPQA